MRWLIGFIFHEMAFGLLSVFVPLYITGYLGGSLIDVGIMITLANFVAVPFSFLWGYLSDKTRRYHFFILLSFSVLTLATMALMIMGIAYGFFLISTLSLSMELIPEGKAGVFNALVGLGGALGCFLGAYIAENYGFQTLFIVVNAGFFLSYMTFKTFPK